MIIIKHKNENEKKNKIKKKKCKHCKKCKRIIYKKINNLNIRNAVNLWCKDKNEAIKIYGYISVWDVSSVTDMSNLFKGKREFNYDISTWDVSNVTNMELMFKNTVVFNQDLSSWNIDYKILGIYKLCKKKINVTQLDEFELDKECHICQNTETNNNIVKVNCCNNNYHKDCLTNWLNINKTCPTCRNEF